MFYVPSPAIGRNPAAPSLLMITMSDLCTLSEVRNAKADTEITWNQVGIILPGIRTFTI